MENTREYHWIVRDMSRACLCTDGVFRRNLRNTDAEYFTITNCSRNTIRSMVAIRFPNVNTYQIRCLKVTEHDYHSPFTGKLHHNMRREMKPHFEGLAEI